MTNFSRITLLHTRRDVYRSRRGVMLQLYLLHDKKSDYAEHHRHCIRCYDQLLAILDRDIAISDTAYSSEPETQPEDQS